MKTHTKAPANVTPQLAQQPIQTTLERSSISRSSEERSGITSKSKISTSLSANDNNSLSHNLGKIKISLSQQDNSRVNKKQNCFNKNVFKTKNLMFSDTKYKESQNIAKKDIKHSFNPTNTFSIVPSIQAKSDKGFKYRLVRILNRIESIVGFNFKYSYKWNNNDWKSTIINSNNAKKYWYKYKKKPPRFRIKFNLNSPPKGSDPKTRTLKTTKSDQKDYSLANNFVFVNATRTKVKLTKGIKGKTKLDEDNNYKRTKGKDFFPGSEDFFDGEKTSIHPNDVQQGDDIANCYLMATMAAIAHTRPSDIKRLIQYRGKGKYDVTIYVNENPNAKPGEGPRTPKVITVNNFFPVKDGRPLYAQKGDVISTSKSEVWVMLIEKAYATYQGSYEGDVSEGGTEWGYSDEAMALLKGYKTLADKPKRFTVKELVKFFQRADKEKIPVVVDTRDLDEDREKEAQKINPNIISKHAYSFERINSDRSINLRDPGGAKYYIKNLKISDFRKFFSQITSGEQDISSVKL